MVDEVKAQVVELVEIGLGDGAAHDEKGRRAEANATPHKREAPGSPCSFGALFKRLVYSEVNQEYGREVFDMCEVCLRRRVEFEGPWPWWIQYNPVFWFGYVCLVMLMAVGANVHRLLGQGGAVPSETLTERRLRIHWIYAFDAYWVVFSLYVIAEVAFRRYENPAAGLRFHLLMLLIQMLWLACNVLGLSAMMRKSETLMRMWVTLNVGWSLELLVVLVLQFISAGPHLKSALWYHLAGVFLFVSLNLMYFRGVWGMYEHKGHPLLVHTGVFLATAFLIGSMWLCVKYAQSSMW